MVDYLQGLGARRSQCLTASSTPGQTRTLVERVIRVSVALAHIGLEEGGGQQFVTPNPGIWLIAVISH
uniref:Transcriptional regulator n=1 Tax=Panagrellus redivivus TaxID=6233 RepID=A0A7E4W276_PANRE